VCDVRRDREDHAVDLDLLVLGLRLFQSQPQAGTTSGIVVDQDPGDSSGDRIVREDPAEILPGARTDLDQEPTAADLSAWRSIHSRSGCRGIAPTA
jgi:hypothetical protein